MAEKQELIIEISVEGTADNLGKLRQELDTLIDMRQELAEKSKTGDFEATKQLEKLNSVIRNTQTEYKAQQRVLDGYTNSVKNNADKQNFANNSIQTNRDLLKQLTAQYIQLKNPSKEATNQIRNLTDTLKRQEAAIGDTRRNVGNYIGDLTQFFGGGALGNVANGFGLISKNVISLSQSLGIFRTALLTSGIGALALAIGSITTYFKSFEEGSELLERTMSGFGGAVDVLASKFGGLGKSIIESVSAATQRTFEENVKSIGETIKNGLIAQVQGVADTYKSLFKVITTFGKEGGAELQDAILRAVTFGAVTRKAIKDTLDEAARAAKQAAEWRRQIQELEESEREYGRVIINNTNEINRLRIAARARGQDFTEQLILLNKAAELEEQNLRIETELAQKRFDIIRQQTNLKREQGLVNEKVTKEEFESEQRLLNLRGQSATLQEKINNQIQSVLDQRREADLKSYEEFVKGIESANKVLAGQAEQEANTMVKIQDNSVKNLRDYIQKKQEFYRKDAESFIKAEQAKYRAAQQIAGAFSSLANAIGENTAAGLVFQKIATGIQIAIDTASAISSAIAGATEAASAGGPSAPFLIAGYIASMIGTVISAVSQASQLLNSSGDVPEPPKAQFAKGVIGLDGEGTETSDSIPAYLSKGESVLTAKATKRFHKELAMMEMSVGNSPNYQFGRGRFATGFIPTIETDGGFVARDIQRNSDITSAISDSIKRGFASAPTPKLSIVEFENKQASRNRSIQVSEA